MDEYLIEKLERVYKEIRTCLNIFEVMDPRTKYDAINLGVELYYMDRLLSDTMDGIRLNNKLSGYGGENEGRV